MSFDPMALAVDWFDAYRSSDLAAMIDLYDAGASLECRCGGSAMTISGAQAVRAYWQQQLLKKPCLELNDILPNGSSTELLYRTRSGNIRALLKMNSGGKISFSACRPVTADGIDG
jgi:hypothetical protein